MNRAAVPIPEKLFFKIGEGCEITGIQAHVLRYWESEFPMLAPQKNRARPRPPKKRRRAPSTTRKRTPPRPKPSNPNRPCASRTTAAQPSAASATNSTTSSSFSKPTSRTPALTGAEHYPKAFSTAARITDRAPFDSRRRFRRYYPPQRDVAQPGSALAWGARLENLGVFPSSAQSATYARSFSNWLPTHLFNSPFRTCLPLFSPLPLGSGFAVLYHEAKP